MSTTHRSQRLFAIAALVAFVVALSARAEDGVDERPPSIAELESRRAAIAADASLDEAEKLELRALYAKAVEHLESARFFEERAARFDAAIRDAPERLEGARAALALGGGPATQVFGALTREQLEEVVAREERAQVDASRRAAEIAREASRRVERRVAVPRLLNAALERFDGITRELRLPPRRDNTPARGAARRVVLLCEREAVRREIAMYELEISSFDATDESLAVERELARRELDAARERVAAWRKRLWRRRKADAAAELDAARRAREILEKSGPELRALAAANAGLATRREEAARRLQELAASIEDSRTMLSAVEKSHAELTRKVEIAGHSKAVGLLIKSVRRSLPDLGERRRKLAARSAELSRVEMALVDLRTQRDVTHGGADVVAREALRVSETMDAELRKLTGQQVEGRREMLRLLVKDYESYFSELIDLDTRERRLIEATDRLLAFIGQRVLWIPSDSRLELADAERARDAIAWLLDGGSWRRMREGFEAAVEHESWRLSLALVLVALVIALTVPARRAVNGIRQRRAAGPLGRRVGLAEGVLAMIASVALAMPIPAALFIASAFIVALGDLGEHSDAVVSGLTFAAVAALLVETIRSSLRPAGLVDTLFGWRAAALRSLRRHALAFGLCLVPCVFVVATLESQGIDVHKSSAGRLVFIGLQIINVVVIWSVSRSRGPLLRELSSDDPKTWILRGRFLWFPLAVATPLVLAGIAVAGYYTTALACGWRILLTGWVLVVLGATWGLTRRLRGAPAGPPLDVAATHSRLRHAPVPRRVLRLVVLLIGITALWSIWDSVLPSLSILDDIELGWTRVRGEVGEVPVTLTDLLLALACVGLTVLIARTIPDAVDLAVLQRLPFDRGIRYAITTTLGYVITLVGLVLSFHEIGVGWSKVQWLAAALTVGLGFGLQEIFANFISGLIILYERPVRVGDTVTVGDVTGTVSQIRFRATVIKDRDNKELLVPNKEFITCRVVNWTLTDPITRVVLDVEVEQASDATRARDVLLETARENPVVLDEPAPAAILMGFGDNSFQFSLRVFIRNVEDLFGVRDELNREIERRLRGEGIDFSSPRREIRFVSGDAPGPLVELPPGVASVASAGGGGRQLGAVDPLTSSEADAVTRVLERALGDRTIAGASIAILGEREVLLRRAFGFADLESRTPFDCDDLVGLESLTTAFTAVLAAIMIDRGRIRLDERVDAYLRELRDLRLRGGRMLARAPTVRELLNHTAGFPSQGQQGWVLKHVKNRVDSVADCSLEEFVAALAEFGLIAAPGERCIYSGIGYSVAARIIEVVCGGSKFRDVMQRELIEPLGMSRTVFRDDSLELPPRYRHEDGRLELRPHIASYAYGTFARPSSGLVAPLDDVARFVDLLRNGGEIDGRALVRAETLDALFAITEEASGEGWGLGFRHAVGRDDLLDTGCAILGARGGLEAWIDRSTDTAGVFLTQTVGKRVTGLAARIRRAIRDQRSGTSENSRSQPRSMTLEA